MTDESIELPLLLDERAEAFHIKGRGVAIVGVIDRRVWVRRGDVIEGRVESRVLFRETIRAIELSCVSPPPPPGVAHCGFLVEGVGGADRNLPFAIWLVARAGDAAKAET